MEGDEAWRVCLRAQGRATWLVAGLFKLRHSTPRPGIMMARMSLAPYTWTESRRMIAIGASIAGRRTGAQVWHARRLDLPGGRKLGAGVLVAQGALRRSITGGQSLVFMASSFAVMRIEALAGPDPTRFSERAQLTPRESAVLRWSRVAATSRPSLKRSNWAKRPFARI